MPGLIADIFVTIKPTRERLPLTVRSLYSLFNSTKREDFRLTVCIDGNESADTDFGTFGEFSDLLCRADYVLQSRENEGLGPTINRAVAHIKSINDWYAHPTHGEPSRVAPYICMCQDDLIYTEGWLPMLASRFRAYGMQHRLGFASGLECVEHPVRQTLVPDTYDPSNPGVSKRNSTAILLKDWIRAAHMLAPREYWESMMPIPRLDPETGRVRTKPNDGMGSGVDWWLIRNHENSVCRTGRTCLVMPGLVKHAGYDQSTWLARDLPESDSDKEAIGGQ